MKQSVYFLALITFTTVNVFALSNGKEVPNFKLQGSDGKEWELSKLKGKTVVLEWFNHGCPFVRKHYDSNNMQALQNKYGKDVVWLVVNSSTQGKQGHLAGVDEAKAQYKKEKMDAAAILLDSRDGKVGKLFSAKTTPHMYIIDKKGLLAYQGAIDSIRSADPDDVKKADNYVAMALDDLSAGKKVRKAKTTPYGCSVKY